MQQQQATPHQPVTTPAEYLAPTLASIDRAFARFDAALEAGRAAQRAALKQLARVLSETRAVS